MEWMMHVRSDDNDERNHDHGTISIQAMEEDYVNVVDTHNRIARVDGRHVHYVRSFGGGNRWSLIFYDTTDRNKTDVIKSGIDLS